MFARKWLIASGLVLTLGITGCSTSANNSEQAANDASARQTTSIPITGVSDPSIWQETIASEVAQKLSSMPGESALTVSYSYDIANNPAPTLSPRAAQSVTVDGSLPTVSLPVLTVEASSRDAETVASEVAQSCVDWYIETQPTAGTFVIVIDSLPPASAGS